jgi:hypothetical protein
VFSTQPNTKFGLLALHQCSGRIAVPLDLGDGLSAHPTCPLDLPEHWQRWLGEIPTKTIVEAKLLIGFVRPSPTPTILDAEIDSLDQQLSGMWRSVLLQGIPSYQGGVMVFAGVNRDGH